MPNYTIRSHEKAIVGGMATHMVLAFYKDGALMREYNGLSTLHGTPVAVGWPWELNDTIRVFSGGRLFTGGSDIKKSVTIYNTGSTSEINNMLSAADTAMGLINAQQLPYKLLSQNSNSAFETLISSLGQSLSDTSGRLIPGRGNQLLDADTIATISKYAAGGQLTAPIKSAIASIEKIGDTLYNFSKNHKVYITYDEITSIASNGDARDLFAKLTSKMSGPEAITEMQKIQDQLENLAEINKNNPNALKNFVPDMVAVAKAAGTIDAFIGAAAGYVSPLVVDLGGDGIETIASLVNGDLFDFKDEDIRGHGWLSGDDAFLAIDKNGNGRIDSVRELFGGQKYDGYTMLAKFDSNADGVISKEDDRFDDIILWRDKNEDGVSQACELAPLSESMESLDLKSHFVDERDSGNWIALGSEGTSREGIRVEIADVYFRALHAEGYVEEASSRYSRVVIGSSRDDYLKGSQKNQLIFTGSGEDVLVIRKNSGNDRVVDFDPEHDRVKMSEDAVVVEDGDGVTIRDGEATLTLSWVSLQQLYDSLI